MQSTSAFNNTGLTVTFGGGCGVVRKCDGNAVLSAWLVKGMYIVDELTDDLPRDHGVPIAMTQVGKLHCYV